MTAGSIFRAFARNNAWANHRLLEACARLTPSELHATRTSFFPTIMKTLNHILIVDWLYVDALERGGRGIETVANEEPFAELPPLRDAQLASDLKLIALVGVTDFDADVAIMTGELGQMIPDLVDALGGWLDPAQPQPMPATDADVIRQTAMVATSPTEVTADVPPWVA